MTTVHRIFGGRSILKAQAELFQSSAFMRVALGGLGSGKTTAGVLCFVQLVGANPWTSDYGNDRPTSAIVSVTFSTLRDSALKALLQVVPDGWIRRYYKAERKIAWCNGHQTVLRSAVGTFTGMNLTHVLFDEAHLIRDGERFADLQMRVRDARAKRLGMIVCAVPEEVAWFRGAVGMPEHYADPKRCIRHLSTYDNHFLLPEVRVQLESSVGAEDAPRYLKGEWHKPSDAVFSTYDAATHVVKEYGDKAKPVVISYDIGLQACVVVGQLRKLSTGQKALLIVDEIYTDGTSTEQTLELVKKRGWKMETKTEAKKGGHEPISKICVDPKAPVDAILAIQRVFPDIDVIKPREGTWQADIACGVRVMRALLRSPGAPPRLHFSSKLPTSTRSLLTTIPSAKPRSGGRYQRPNNEHALDCCRMLCVSEFPLVEAPKVMVARRRSQ